MDLPKVSRRGKHMDDNRMYGDGPKELKVYLKGMSITDPKTKM